MTWDTYVRFPRARHIRYAAAVLPIPTAVRPPLLHTAQALTAFFSESQYGLLELACSIGLDSVPLGCRAEVHCTFSPGHVWWYVQRASCAELARDATRSRLRFRIPHKRRPDSSRLPVSPSSAWPWRPVAVTPPSQSQTRRASTPRLMLITATEVTPQRERDPRETSF